MPGEASNSETARRALARWSRNDLDGTLELIDPEIEWHLGMRLPDLPLDKDVYRGHEEVRELWELVRSGWEELTLEIEEVIHEDGELLLTRVRFRGRGVASGIEVDRTVFYVMRIRDDLLVRIEPFETLADARRAAGLDG